MKRLLTAIALALCGLLTGYAAERVRLDGDPVITALIVIAVWQTAAAVLLLLAARSGVVRITIARPPKPKTEVTK